MWAEEWVATSSCSLHKQPLCYWLLILGVHCHYWYGSSTAAVIQFMLTVADKHHIDLDCITGTRHHLCVTADSLLLYETADAFCHSAATTD